jgi:poly[(R)-3-hydroxyalkanoate] polymerase subunit PhaC
MIKTPSPKKIQPRKRARAKLAAVTETTPQPRPAALEAHPHQNLDRASRAAVALMTGGVAPHAYLEAWSDWAQHLSRAPGRQLELIERAQENVLKLMAQAVNLYPDAVPAFKPKAYDHRFRHPGWQKAPFNLMQQEFLAAQDWWDYATDYLRGLRPQDADRTRFMARQMLDLFSPSNFPALNPEIIEQTLKCNGKNLSAGAAHFFHDFLNIFTHAHEPVPEGYRIGEDLACTPGEVVFRNELFELIQYAPQTEKVKAEPILIVPAWIMKYYILDLSPHNSLVRYLVGQGFTVFMISWCNPGVDQADLSLEDYRERGVMKALDTVNSILPHSRVHAVGYCLGGTILAIAAATMAREKDVRLASITLMAAQVDFAEAGELLLFLDESQVAFLEDMMWEKGYLDRPQMARTFSVIRSEDLIYSRAVRRYLLGKEDVPTDMGVWVTDTTRMPAKMHSEYLRGLFLENRLTAGRFAVEGRVIALKDISAPMFVVATETDHIAPWNSVYKSQLFTDNDLTFVLTSGGHNSGIVNEPGKARGHHRISHRPAGALYVGPEAWLNKNVTRLGSWWPEWRAWLENKSSGVTPAPDIGAPEKGLGSIIPAPGTYVHQI